ncbi:MAG TPA: hypothetical protein VGB88_04040 [Alphaproteobacteria bacterium]
MKRQPPIPQRKLAFVGCEGDGELAYVALLNHIATARNLHIWFRAEALNPGAGDHCAVVERAAARLAHRKRQGTRYLATAVLLDRDQWGTSKARDTRSVDVAKRHGLLLVWQRPDHEALLLRHLDGCQALQPPATVSLNELKKRWPEYDKSGMTAARLDARVGYQQILQACTVEAELRQFLKRMGMI